MRREGSHPAPRYRAAAGRRALLLTTLLGTGSIASSAAADTLADALAHAYATNPTLSAARAALRATDETVPLARAEALPSLSANTSLNQTVASTANSLVNPPRSAVAGVTATTPLYTGGRITANVRSAEQRILAGREQLRATESQLFTAVVGAYEDVIRDTAVLQLNQGNVRALEYNLRATERRFAAGDLTRTDIAQSQSRLDLARAGLESAEAQLIASRESYLRLVGVAPKDLAPSPPLPNLPGNPNGAIAIALRENPTLKAQQRGLDATAFDVRAARALRSPQVGVSVGGNYQNFLGSLGQGTGVSTRQGGFGLTGGLTLALPLFQGGMPAARERQAQALRSQAMEQVTEAERLAIADTRSAFARWESAQDIIRSAESSVAASELALRGVRAENSVGDRTIIEVLNAEQELLNSRVTLVTARRDAYVAGFALLAAMGRAEADDLGFEGSKLYQPAANYERVRNRINDRARVPEAAPVATRTVTSAPQTAEIATSALVPGGPAGLARPPAPAPTPVAPTAAVRPAPPVGPVPSAVPVGSAAPAATVAQAPTAGAASPPVRTSGVTATQPPARGASAPPTVIATTGAASPATVQITQPVGPARSVAPAAGAPSATIAAPLVRPPASSATVPQGPGTAPAKASAAATAADAPTATVRMALPVAVAPVGSVATAATALDTSPSATAAPAGRSPASALPALAPMMATRSATAPSATSIAGQANVRQGGARLVVDDAGFNLVYPLKVPAGLAPQPSN